MAEYVAANPLDLAFMTTFELAKRTGVSEASIVRFARALDYSGYPALQQEIRDLVEQVFSPAQMMHLSTYHGEARDEDILARVAEDDIESIRATVDQISREDFTRAVDLLFNAPSVFVYGVRGLHSPAFYAYHYLNQIRPGVQLVDGRRVSDQFARADSTNAVLSFLFARYNRQTTEAIQFLHQRGAHQIIIADSYSAPSAEYAEVLFRVKATVNGFFRSHASTLSVLNALIAGVALRDPERSQEQLELLEESLTSFHTLTQERDPNHGWLPVIGPTNNH